MERHEPYRDDALINETVSNIEELIRHFVNAQSTKEYVLEIYSDLKKLIDELEEIGKEYRVQKHQLIERIKQVLKYYPYAKLENTVSILRKGEIKILMEEVNTVRVAMDQGAVVGNNCEIFTYGLMNCVAIFIINGRGKALIHMTAKGSLAYQKLYLSRSINYVMESVKVLRGTREDFQVVIFGNMEGNFLHSKLWNEWGDIKDEFLKHHIKLIKIVELPLVETVIYHFPQQQEYIYILGTGTYLDSEGHIRHKGKIDIYKIPVDPQIRVDFGIKRNS